ncbi:MAG: hypothetical protein FJ087_01950 [Deltaproteobacteria bacterium]|nr:hypothetical protein [Deltaproteobacteria bacterium]
MRRPCITPSLLVFAAVACGDAAATVGADVEGGPDPGLDPAAEAAPEVRPDAPGEAPPPGLPPSVAILEPIVPTFLQGCDSPAMARLRVSADLPVARVSLNGKHLEPATGEAETTYDPLPGLTLLEASARDEAGRVGREHRAVLCGAYAPPGEAVPHAADVWLGRAALAAVGRLASATFDAADLTAAFATMGTLYETSSLRVVGGKVDRLPGTVVSLVPAWDRVFANVTVSGFEAWVRLELTGGETYDIGVLSERVEVRGELVLDVDDAGDVVAVLSDLAVDLGPMMLEVSGVGDVLEAFPGLRDRIVAAVAGQIEAWVLGYVPGAVSSALGHLRDPVPLSLLDRSFAVRFRPSEVDVRPAGVQVALDVAVEGLDPDPTVETPGALRTAGDPEPPEPEGVRLAIRDDLLNGVFHEMWRSGLVRFVVDQPFLDRYKVEVGLVAGFLGGVLDLLPGRPDPETPISIAIDARLPPVADVDLPVSGGVRIGLGELRIDVATEDGTPLVGLAVTVRVDGEVRPAGVGGVRLTFHALDVALDLLDPDGSLHEAESYLEGGTAGLLDSLGPLLNGMLGTIPMPSFGGFTVANVAVGTLPGAGGTLVLSGDLVEAK